MELLIAVLLKLGFFYTPDQIKTSTAAGHDEQVIHAQRIIDDGHYRLEEDGGVVIEDDVDPHN